MKDRAYYRKRCLEIMRDKSLTSLLLNQLFPDVKSLIIKQFLYTAFAYRYKRQCGNVFIHEEEKAQYYIPDCSNVTLVNGSCALGIWQCFTQDAAAWSRYTALFQHIPTTHTSIRLKRYSVFNGITDRVETRVYQKKLIAPTHAQCAEIAVFDNPKNERAIFSPPKLATPSEPEKDYSDLYRALSFDFRRPGKKTLLEEN